MAEWEDNCKELESDLKVNGYSRCLQFPIIRRTMFHIIKDEAFEKLQEKGYLEKWKEAIKENAFGNPPVYDKYPESSGNLLHHAYSLSRIYEEVKDFKIQGLTNIYEFGGGYGSFARLCYKLGFNGTYTIQDLPIFSKLQAKYLKGVGLQRKDTIYRNEEPGTKTDIDLFVALWSLSEAPIEVRENLLKQINPKYILIAYQCAYGGRDNCKFFTEMTEKYDNYNWATWEMNHIPLSHYLIGEKYD